MRRPQFPNSCGGGRWPPETPARPGSPGLADIVGDLAAAWGLAIGQTLAGGTEALVVEATMADGRQAVLNLAMEEAGDILAVADAWAGVDPF